MTREEFRVIGKQLMDSHSILTIYSPGTDLASLERFDKKLFQLIPEGIVNEDDWEPIKDAAEIGLISDPQPYDVYIYNIKTGKGYHPWYPEDHEQTIGYNKVVDEIEKLLNSEAVVDGKKW